ncbi:hypothetical protein Tco_1565937, partial [Tanacetum coccineum]
LEFGLPEVRCFWYSVAPHPLSPRVPVPSPWEEERDEVELEVDAAAEALYGYIKNHKKTVKNKQAQTRESEEYKAEARKVNP